MSELDDAKAGWRDKRLDRIETLLDSSAAKADRNADLIAENERKHAASRAKTEALIAENAKGIAELKEAMKWMPLKAGLWTLTILLAVIVVFAKTPSAVSTIKSLLGIV